MFIDLSKYVLCVTVLENFMVVTCIRMWMDAHGYLMTQTQKKASWIRLGIGETTEKKPEDIIWYARFTVSLYTIYSEGPTTLESLKPEICSQAFLLYNHPWSLYFLYSFLTVIYMPQLYLDLRVDLHVPLFFFISVKLHFLSELKLYYCIPLL